MYYENVPIKVIGNYGLIIENGCSMFRPKELISMLNNAAVLIVVATKACELTITCTDRRLPARLALPLCRIRERAPKGDS
jgi:hypothetical protein